MTATVVAKSGDRNSVCAANRLPVESDARRVRVGQRDPRRLSRVGAARCLSQTLYETAATVGASRVRRVDRDRLAMAKSGCRDDEGSAGRGTKPSPPTDLGKLRVKRSVLTDGCGVPLGVAVAGANAHEQALKRETLQCLPVRRPPSRPRRRQPLWIDKGRHSRHRRSPGGRDDGLSNAPARGPTAPDAC